MVIVKLNDWPLRERPRHKLLSTSSSALSDGKLLAVLLGAGPAGGNGALQPHVLSPQLLKPLSLIHFHPAVNLTLAIVGLVGNTDPFADLADIHPLA